MHSESRLEVNLRLIQKNYDAMMQGHNIQAYAVVKANSYGLGALRVARQLRGRVKGFCVATPMEAIALREGGITDPILVFGYMAPSDHHALLRRNLQPAISTLEEAKDWDREAAAQGKICNVHFAIDTGHRRVGFLTDTPEGREEMLEAAKLPHLRVEGIYSHFSTADEPNEDAEDMAAFPNAFAAEQMASFDRAVALLESVTGKLTRHIGNDAGLMTFPDEALYDTVRLGICLYGHFPSFALEGAGGVQLSVPYRWVAPITRVKWIGPGESVSYGRTWYSKRPTKVATVQVGYADGYLRALSNEGWMQVNGVRCPVIGRVCMDQTMLDVTEAAEVAPGDEVLVMGAPDWDHADTDAVRAHGVLADDLADKADTISYELLTSIQPRVRRAYVEQ